MPRIADYVTIQDASFPLTGVAGNHFKNIGFTVNSDAVLNRSDSRPIISYKVRPLQAESSTGQKPGIRVEINGQQIESITNLSVAGTENVTGTCESMHYFDVSDLPKPPVCNSGNRICVRLFHTF